MKNNLIKFSNCSCEIPKGRFDINNIDLTCKATWNLISSGHTTGIFQLESNLGQQWCKKVKPQNINELSDLIAIIRPGVLDSGLSQEYVDNKFGKSEPSYIHPILKTILETTHGVMVYQEQLIKIAQKIAGFSLIESDNLRKAVGKKLPELMSKMKIKFMNGAEKVGLISKQEAEKIFGWIEKSQKYSFNLSHSISYAHLGYQTAYLKTHFPHEFFCSYFTYSPYKGDPKEEIYKLVQDARLFGIKIFPPNLKRKNINFEILEDSGDLGIAFGLSCIRSVGQRAITKIIEKSQDDFKTWYDFLKAIPGLHRDVGLALIKSGACDCYGLSRNDMVNQLEIILGTTERDSDGNKIEVKGLTDKEKEIFFEELKETDDFSKALSNILDKAESVQIYKLKKDELKSFYVKITNEDARGLTKKQMIDNLRAIDDKYDNTNFKVTTKRIPEIRKKIKQLAIKKPDENRFNAIAEKEFLGIQLTCSAIDDIEIPNEFLRCIDVAQSPNNKNVKFYGIIDNVKHTKTKRGKNIGSPMCFLTLSDSTYSIEKVVVFPDSYEMLKDVCKKDLICKVSGHKKDGSLIITDMRKII